MLIRSRVASGGSRSAKRIRRPRHCQVWHHEYADPAGLPRLGHAVHPGGIRRHVLGQLLEVLRRDRPAPRTQQHRPAGLGVGQGLRLGPADGRTAVLHPGDVRDAGLEHPDLSPGHVARPAAAGRYSRSAARAGRGYAP